jgi:hypothetical protein
MLPRDATALSRRMRGPSARAVGSFVPKLTRKLLERYGFSAATLVTDWTAIVGHDLAAYAQPERLKWPRAIESDAEAGGRRTGATLQLRVEGARALDVQYRSRQIIERINAHFGYRAVAELRLLQAPVGGLPAPRPEAAARPRSTPARPSSREVAGIPDERLRSALERLQASVAGEALGR